MCRRGAAWVDLLQTLVSSSTCTCQHIGAIRMELEDISCLSPSFKLRALLLVLMNRGNRRSQWSWIPFINGPSPTFQSPSKQSRSSATSRHTVSHFQLMPANHPFRPNRSNARYHFSTKFCACLSSLEAYRARTAISLVSYQHHPMQGKCEAATTSKTVTCEDMEPLDATLSKLPFELLVVVQTQVWRSQPSESRWCSRDTNRCVPKCGPVPKLPLLQSGSGDSWWFVTFPVSTTNEGIDMVILP